MIRRPHDWQQFTECCLACGYNAYDKNIPDNCPGNYDKFNAEQRRKDAAAKAKQDKEWGDGPW